MSTDIQTIDRPGYSAIVGLAVNGLDSEHSKRQYAKALSDFLAWHTSTGNRPLSRAVVSEYREHLKVTGTPETSINQRLVAIRRLAAEAAENGLIDHATAQSIRTVKGIARRGERAGNWLSKAEAEALIATPDKTTLRGKRDRAMLGVLIGCGLRREELARLTVEHLQQREGRWAIVDIVGKRNKVRTVPMAAWTKALIDAWLQAAGITSGAVFITVTQTGKMDTGNTRGRDRFGRERRQRAATTPQSVYRMLRRYGAEIGRPALAPHDLRRTYAKLARAGGAALEQIQINLGHESLETTERYLGAQLDYQHAPADYLDIHVDVK